MVQKQPVLKSTTVTSGTFEFTKVFLGVSKIEFKSERESVDFKEEIEYKSNYQFDVLNETCTPELPFVEMNPGVYTKLEFKVDDILSTGNSIEIFGSFNDGVEVYSFEFTSTMSKEYEIENEDGIELAPGDELSFVLMMALESMFDGVDFSTLDVDTDGVIRINSESNSHTASIIENNIEHIMELDGEHHSNDHEDKEEHEEDGEHDDENGEDD